MTTPTTTAPITNLADMIRRGTPGDRYTEDHSTEPKRRLIKTYVMVERVSDTKVILNRISSRHHGRNEYICDQIENCYETTYTAVPTELKPYGGITETFHLYDGKTVLAHRETGVTRYSAKNLRNAHDIGLAQYDAWNPMTATATATEDDSDWDDEDDVWDGTCSHCGTTLRTDTRQDLTGSRRCDDTDPNHQHHIPEGSDD